MRFFKSLLITASLFSLLFIPLAHSQVATTVIQKTVTTRPERIITAPPQATCVTVEGAWVGNTWISSHSECTYTGRTEGAAWIDGSWSCSTYDTSGNCTAWTWVPGHWVAKYP